jgi:short-subunit dehydrogenase
MKKILIIGATSAIAEGTARLYANDGARLFLVARSSEKLHTIATDLSIRGASSVGTATLDINAIDSHETTLDQAWAELGGVDIVLLAHGTLPDQAACEASVKTMLSEFATNGTSGLALLTLIAHRMASQGNGCIAVITSVAGDRGRQSNYVYGAAKAATSTFLGGLRQRLDKRGVAVVDIRPGFVDTPMTAHIKKGPLWAAPEQVAAGILKAIERRKAVVYLPSFWALIMWIIRHIPNAIFRKLSL